MSLKDLRRLEADFAKRAGGHLGPQSPVQIGPKGVTLGIQMGVQIPFILLLKGNPETGQAPMPSEAIKLIIDASIEELKGRGVKY